MESAEHLSPEPSTRSAGHSRASGIPGDRGEAGLSGALNRFRIPSSTYRIQFTPDFNFQSAQKLVGYLHELGVGDIYASPTFAAMPGSQHGYDVADSSRVSSDLGGEEAFRALASALKERGMGLLLDIVPNHMAASVVNPWWADLLENGRASRYAPYFDIDWEPSIGKGALNDKILLPVLGRIYGAALENGEIAIAFGDGGFSVRYYELELPVAPRSYERILGDSLEAVESPDVRFPELRRHLSEAFARAAGGTGDVESPAGAMRDALRALRRGYPEFRAAVERRIEAINGERGNPASFGELDSILEEQSYRLAYWRRAADEINYRRFFDISDLVGVRVEIEEVFRERHELVGRMFREGVISGLRIDHIDGLRDPEDYLNRLQRLLSPLWGGDPRKPDAYVVVEKILAPEESLPDAFATAGSSGYNFLNVVNNLFVDPAGLRALDRIYRSASGVEADFADIAYGGKQLVLQDLFAGDVRRLGDELLALASRDRYARDVPARQLTRALLELTAHLGVYRTYTRDTTVREKDRAWIERAFQRARGMPFMSRRAIEFVRRVLLLEPPAYAEDQKTEWLRFVMGWQQLTGRVMAKGVEDTAFYVYNRLISMNDVGGEPDLDPVRAVLRFHQHNRDTAARWPHRMNATSTHDTKRSEDVRTRIDVLSEIPDRWQRTLERWQKTNRRKKRIVEGVAVPDSNEEIMLYQTLLGMWPLDRTAEKHVPARIESFIIKALREGKVHSRWTRPDEEYERAFVEFAHSLVKRSRLGWFRDFETLQRFLAHFGAINSLSQLVLKAMAPGVPDFYQGTEIWNLSVVDPDNRRAVNYERRMEMLGSLEKVRDPSKLLPKWPDGRLKMFVTRALLRLRRENEELFRDGDYAPVRTGGVRAEHIVAFTRSHGGARIAVAVPRLATRLVEPPSFPIGRRVWKQTLIHLPAGRWKNVFTGEVVDSRAAEDVFATFPVAVLVQL